MNSLEFYWGSVSLLCRAFPKDTKISDWSVCDFIKSLQDNRYVHGLAVCKSRNPVKRGGEG